MKKAMILLLFSLLLLSGCYMTQPTRVVEKCYDRSLPEGICLITVRSMRMG